MYFFSDNGLKSETFANVSTERSTRHQSEIQSR